VTRFGIVALAGLPNVGKSTLLNALVGESLSIVSPKPQTTREPVRGLLSDGDSQILFVDPAGLLDPAYPMQRAMLEAAIHQLAGADLVLHLHPLADAPAPSLHTLIESLKVEPSKKTARGIESRTLTAYTKADIAPAGARLRAGDGALVVSATTLEGVPALLAAIRSRLPEGPFHYDADDVGTQPLRFFAAEFVREAAFASLEQELPYSLAVVIDEFREAETPVYIRATMAVERESQKPIVLGKGGRTIKAIGTAARVRLEALLGRRVRLELWVTVWPRWRKDPAALARLGLPLATEKS
jgi:GTP-binding protein Era